jgi:hypothetical protein
MRFEAFSEETESARCHGDRRLHRRPNPRSPDYIRLEPGGLGREIGRFVSTDPEIRERHEPRECVSLVRYLQNLKAAPGKHVRARSDGIASMLQVGTDPKGRAAGKRLWFQRLECLAPLQFTNAVAWLHSGPPLDTLLPNSR